MNHDGGISSPADTCQIQLNFKLRDCCKKRKSSRSISWINLNSRSTRNEHCQQLFTSKCKKQNVAKLFRRPKRRVFLSNHKTDKDRETADSDSVPSGLMTQC